MNDKVENGKTNLGYYFQVNARTGAPGYADDDSYISCRYNTFGGAYGALTSFQPGRQFSHLRRVQGMWIWQEGMEKVEVHDSNTMMRLIELKDLANLSISEGEFDMIIDSINKKPQLGVQNDVVGLVSKGRG